MVKPIKSQTYKTMNIFTTDINTVFIVIYTVIKIHYFKDSTVIQMVRNAYRNY